MPPLTLPRQHSTFNLRVFFSTLFSARFPSALQLSRQLNFQSLTSGSIVNRSLSGVTPRHRKATADTAILRQDPPTFTKTTAVFDVTTSIVISPNVTKDPYFAHLVASIDALRLQLIKDKTLREPLLLVLLSLYKSKNTKKTIRRIRPKLPTHADIISFVDEFWPDILLVNKSDSEDGHVWGYTFCGVDAVPDAEVRILKPLVKQWIESGEYSDPPTTLSTNALCWFINSVIAHETLHRLIVWWGRGECHTPEIDGIEKEAGSFVERAWYGGITVAEFPKDKRGVFTAMLSVGVEIGDSYYPIDRPTAAELLHMDTSKGLPIFRPQYPAPPHNPGTIRVKSEDAQNFSMSKATETGNATEPKVETATWRHLQNDKIPYEDRFKYY